MAFTGDSSATSFLPPNLKPAHLPMSDNEDTTEEPYSQSYHDRMSKISSARTHSQSDLAPGAAAASPKVSADTPAIQNTNNGAASSLQIVSVCSLPPDSDLFQRDSPEKQRDKDSRSEKPAKVCPLATSPEVRRVFGIARVNVKGPSEEDSDSNPDQLLVEQTSKQQETLKRRKGPLPKPAASKLIRIREKLNKRFARQNITHLSRAVLESAISSANTTDQDGSEDESEESGPPTKIQHFDVDRTEPTTSRSENRRKTAHQPIVSDEMEFINDEDEVDPLALPDDQQQIPADTRGTSTRKRSASSVDSSCALITQLDVVREMPNPNADLMKKVAFLRTCVNYMLKELGRTQLEFKRGMTLAEMKAHYHHSKHV